MARPVAATAIASFIRMDCLPFGLEIHLPTIPLIELIARRYFALDVDRHRLAVPVRDERGFAKVPVHELLGEFVAAEFEKLHVRLDASIERHGNAPWPREHVGILD